MSGKVTVSYACNGCSNSRVHLPGVCIPYRHMAQEQFELASGLLWLLLRGPLHLACIHASCVMLLPLLLLEVCQLLRRLQFCCAGLCWLHISCMAIWAC